MPWVLVGFLAFCVLGGVFCAMMLRRNNIVCDCQRRANEMTHARTGEILGEIAAMPDAKAKMIALDKFPPIADRCHTLQDSYGSYEEMLNNPRNFRKWKFEDFYPGLEAKLKAIGLEGSDEVR
jgi:hypothetical protein